MLERTKAFLGRTSVVLGKSWVALFEQGVGADDLQRSLPTPATLQVSDTLQLLPPQDSSFFCENSRLNMDVNHLLNFSIVCSCQKEDYNSKSLSGGTVSSQKETLDLHSLTMVWGHTGQLAVGDLDIAQQPTSVVFKSHSTCRSPVDPRM